MAGAVVESGDRRERLAAGQRHHMVSFEDAPAFGRGRVRVAAQGAAARSRQRMRLPVAACPRSGQGRAAVSSATVSPIQSQM
ncbi:hypothetical protein GCM10009548_49830 [Streptomyces malaysiensis subsp. malaysiensis]